MKNKIIAVLIIGFSLFFISFIVAITNEMSSAGNSILKSPNVIDVTDTIKTKVLVTEHDLPVQGSWTTVDFDESNWTSIKIPSYQIVQQTKFRDGHFAYYRIKIPKNAFDKISTLQDETSILLQSVYFNRLDISVNGKFAKTSKPKNPGEFKLIVPVEEGIENLIAVKGYIKEGDTGFDSRDKIILGKSTELNEIFSATYKGQTVFQLVFILCKGSVLFIFALIFLLLKVDKSFEKFFVFGLCAVVEELIAGDYLFGPLNFNQMVYLYNSVNAAGAIALFLFLAELVNFRIDSKTTFSLSVILVLISSLLAADALHSNYVVDLTLFMKCWNLLTACILIFYSSKIFKFDHLMFTGLFVVICLYLYGVMPSNNIGTNFKAYGNLLLFFMVAYQTFTLFRREQIQLKEQEKDVVIGKTASLLAHDIRKPLEQMKLVIERMVSGDADKEFLEMAKTDIDISISNVSQQVDDIINYNKKSILILKEISFYKVLGHSVKQVMSIHQEMSLNLEYDLQANVKVLGDESRLSGILVNLISNAVEAIRDIGGKYHGRIKFSTAVSGNEFSFRIFNDGPQIPEKVITEIFKPLYTNGKAAGTGLGLASCTKAAREMNGSMRVSNTNNGVEFSLVMQTSASSDNIEQYKFYDSSNKYNYNPVTKVSTTTRQELRILVVERDAAIREELNSQFEKLPYNVAVKFADDKSDAENLISKMRFDIYLLRDELGGEDLFQKHLNFLSSEVMIYSTQTVPHLDPRFIEKIYETRKKLLFVDDTKLFRVAWQMFHGNHNITCVSSPEEALQLLSYRGSEFDIYVLDFHFSNSTLNGQSLASRITEIRKDAKIFISSSLEQKIPGLKGILKSQYEVRGLL